MGDIKELGLKGLKKTWKESYREACRREFKGNSASQMI